MFTSCQHFIRNDTVLCKWFIFIHLRMTGPWNIRQKRYFVCWNVGICWNMNFETMNLNKEKFFMQNAGHAWNRANWCRWFSYTSRCIDAFSRNAALESNPISSKSVFLSISFLEIVLNNTPSPHAGSRTLICWLLGTK